MKLTTMTVLLVALCAAALVTVFLLTRDERLGIRAAGFWCLLWVALGFFSLFPGTLDTLMHVAQMQDRPFFLSMCGILVLLALVFNLNTALDTTRRQFGQLVQELALEDLDRQLYWADRPGPTVRTHRGAGAADAPDDTRAGVGTPSQRTWE